MRKEVTLLAVGDIMLGDSPTCFGFGVGSVIRKHGPIYPFEHVIEELRKSDLVFGNLEVVISGFCPASDAFSAVQFRARPEAVEGLLEAGFDVLSVATNHTMQHGRAALEETLAILTEHNIRFTGVEIPEKKIYNHCLLEKDGLRFCFLGYNFRPQQYFIDPPLWITPDLDHIKEDIDALRAKADIIVVSLHWGDEFIECPSPHQVELAHELIDHGANIILGHHPHILQGVEKYNGGVIAYSLGNFVFDMWQRRLRRSMILKVTISGSAVDYDIIPVVINRNHQPQIVRGQKGDDLGTEISNLSDGIRNGTADRYYTELRKNTRRYRREVYVHYLTHLRKYNLKRLGANFLGAIGKRLVK